MWQKKNKKILKFWILNLDSSYWATDISDNLMITYAVV